jgi:hypothetical protein
MTTCEERAFPRAIIQAACMKTIHKPALAVRAGTSVGLASAELRCCSPLGSPERGKAKVPASRQKV